MTKTAVVLAPGRGSYNSSELGYLSRFHPNQTDLISGLDAIRRDTGQSPISELDSAGSFSREIHTTGDAASPLIYACGFCDFLSIDQAEISIVGVTGNSMGWYTALACAGAVSPNDGFRIANTMGTLMQENMIGGQLIYPFVDDNWVDANGRRAQIMDLVNTINTQQDAQLGLSIELGGMLVLAGNEAGLAAFEKQVEPVDGRFPMRLPNHAAFHTHLQKPVAEIGRQTLGMDLFQQPTLPLIDGRGAIWEPNACDLNAMWDYTLGHQVIEPFDFTAALRTAAREFMPDVFIVLGPGNSLGGATAQALIQANWRGWSDKAGFKNDQGRLVSMGIR
jgi:[acyl-carrier-protein] S-malonyltransferase